MAKEEKVAPVSDPVRPYVGQLGPDKAAKARKKMPYLQEVENETEVNKLRKK
jgi:hypothetical protein